MNLRLHAGVRLGVWQRDVWATGGSALAGASVAHGIADMIVLCFLDIPLHHGQMSKKLTSCLLYAEMCTSKLQEGEGKQRVAWMRSLQHLARAATLGRKHYRAGTHLDGTSRRLMWSSWGGPDPERGGRRHGNDNESPSGMMDLEARYGKARVWAG
jgi:hypothetical protein